MHLLRTMLIAALLLVSTGCSVKFAYNNVDRLVRWQIGDYLDLDATQRTYLKDEVATLMAWHRVTHLPVYADYVEDLAVQFGDGVSEAQIESLFMQFMLWGEEIEERAMPMAIHLMRSMSDAQVAALPQRLAKSNLEFSEDELDVSVAEIQADWIEGYTDFITRFTGRLDKQQKAYLNLRATAYQPERVLWVEYRERWQADLMTLLEDRQKEDFGVRFRALAEARESYYGDDYTQISRANIELGREVSSYLLSNLNERQSERVRESLLALAEDLAELAAQKS